jgi:mersacidin/lichenicidin family type 2 lantibiotic
MSKLDTIRAWKGEEFRTNPSDEQQALPPENLAGPIELIDSELEHIDGGVDHSLLSFLLDLVFGP